MNIKQMIITLVALSVALFTVLFASEKIFNKTIIPDMTPSSEQEAILPIMDIKEQYVAPTYTFVGSIDVPTPCHTLNAKVNQISDVMFEIEVNTISPGDDVMCAQVISTQQFSVSFDAPKDILVYAKINGEIYELSRFVIPEGENINNYDLFIKG